MEKNKQKMAKLKSQIQISEGKHFGSRFPIVIACFLIIELETILRGNSEKSLIGINQCTIGDWISFMALGTVAFAISLVSTKYLTNVQEKRRKSGYPIDKTDIIWDYSTSIRIMTISFFFGFLGGGLDIGEGTLLVPLLVELGRHPKIASATGMYMSIIFSSGIVTVFSIEGYLDDLYFIPFGVICAAATVLGIFISEKCLKHRFAKSVFDYKIKQFILFFPMAIYFAVCAFCVPYVYLNRVFQTDKVRKSIWDSGKYCTS